MYNDTVIDHLTSPRNTGEIPDADGYAEVTSPACGDMMQIFIRVEENRIADAKFRTFGCGAAIASSSMATELIRGKTLEEAWAVSNGAVVRALGGLPEPKVHCSVLAEDGIHAAINNYRARMGLPLWEESAGETP